MSSENDYAYARKCVEIAIEYGFDGWFINDEAFRGQTEWANWIAEFYKHALAMGHPELEIQYYDNGTTAVNKSNILKTPSASYYLDHRNGTAPIDNSNINNQRSLMGKADFGLFTDDDYYRKIYFGVAQQGSYTTNGNAFKVLFPTSGHLGSLTIFNHEETTGKKVLNSGSLTGDDAYLSVKEMFVKEMSYWVNPNGDPSNSTRAAGNIWPGMATAIAERSTIQNKPFFTSFSTGLGKARYLKGENKRNQEWAHTGVQDILPTWTWWIDAPSTGGTKDITAEYDFDVAYNKGNSLKLSGLLTSGKDNLIRLYKTKLKIESGDKFRLVYKSPDGVGVELKAGITENGNEFETFVVEGIPSVDGWKIADVDLSSLNGKTISILALNIKGNSSFNMYLGELGIYGSSDLMLPKAPSNVKMMNSSINNTGNTYLITWDPVENIDHYDIFATIGNETTLAGQTRQSGYVLSGYDRMTKDQTFIKFTVKAVSKAFVSGSESSVLINFPELQAPTGNINLLTPSIVKVGQVVEAEAVFTNYPDAYEWILSDGITLLSQTDNKATLRFDVAGEYDIAVKAINAKGETSVILPKAVLCSNTTRLVNVGAQKKIINKVLNGYVNPAFGHGVWSLTDECLTCEKWFGKKSDAANNDFEPFAVIDLEKEYMLYKLVMYDVKTVEPDQPTLTDYSYYVSNDNENWTLVSQIRGSNASIKEDWISPISARYVKFVPDLEEWRVYELQIMGLDGTMGIEENESFDGVVGDVYKMQTAYSLGEYPKKEDFEINVVSNNERRVRVSDILVDDNNNLIKYNLTIVQDGAASVTVILKNNGLTRTATYNILGVDSNATNLALNKLVDVVTGGSGSDSSSDSNPNNLGVVAITDGNKETYWLSDFDETDSFENMITIDLGQKANLNKFIITFAPDGDFNRIPKSIQIQTSLSQVGPYFTRYSIFDEAVKEENQIQIEKTQAQYVRAVIVPKDQYGFALTQIEAYGVYMDDEQTPIYTVADLEQVRSNYNGNFILMNNLDLSGIDNFAPLGLGKADGGEGEFSGVFDGNGYTISNLKMYRESWCTGLFGSTNGATVKNLIVKNADVTSTTGGVGILIGTAKQTIISQCAIIGGKLSGADHVGSIIGGAYNDNNSLSNTVVSNCYSTAEVNLTGPWSGCGGIIGCYQGVDVNNVYFAGVISTGNSALCGGLTANVERGRSNKVKGFLNAATSMGRGWKGHLANLFNVENPVSENVMSVSDSYYLPSIPGLGSWRVDNPSGDRLAYSTPEGMNALESNEATLLISTYVAMGYDMDNIWYSDNNIMPVLRVDRSNDFETHVDIAVQLKTKVYTQELNIFVEVGEQSLVSIYTLAGELVNSSVVVNKILMPMSAKGIYIVKVNSEVFKVALW